MNFEELLEYQSPRGFAEGTIYWEFSLYKLKTPKLTRQGDAGYQAHDDSNCSELFRFGDFEKFKEAYIAAHEENIRRMKENEGPLLEIGPMRSGDWPPWQTGGDPCG